MSFFGNRRQPEPEPEIIETRIPHPQPPQQPMISAPQPIGFETVLGANSSLEGKLISTSNVRLDGSFSGTLEINGNVLIGETAKINADINAKNISIAGAVRGNVNGKKVQILRTGRVWGDIVAMALTTEEGAFIDGKISMSNHEASGAPTPRPIPVIAEAETPNREPDFLSDEDSAPSES
ncbi:MAG: polymer-forming cytoskeletal protein [Anaerolineae bacterium]|jgi:cytoskeletal protein CcmA (bactofilin family)|nr:polymer-forming cytoskeletal protein [Anaerolineae bacterium]